VLHQALGIRQGKRPASATHSLSVTLLQRLPPNHGIVPQVNFDNVSQELGIVSKAAA
jgi:hypothetical protein